MVYNLNQVLYPRSQLAENKFPVSKRKFEGNLKIRIFLVQIKNR
jgi:hypothetical protein